MKIALKLLALLSIFLVEISGFAGHIVGGHLSYTCDSATPNQLKARLALYRDCSSTALPSSITVDISSACIAQSTVTLNLISGSPKDVTPVCPQFPNTPCPGTPNTNIQVPIGVEEYVYEGVLPYQGTCQVFLSYYEPNGRIAQYGDFFIYNSFRLSAPCNNSPQYLAPPVPFTCVNQLFTLNPGASDPEGDSLAFSLVNCLEDGFTPIQNALPVISDVFVMHTNTGSIQFTPSQQQISLVCIKTEEYRNGVKIGESVRDMQLITTNCANPSPILSGLNGTNNFDTTICPGQPVQLTINSLDVNQFQTVKITYSGSISGAAFTSNGAQYPTGTLTWTPPAGVTGIFLFSVTAQDDGCPIPAVTSKSYVINVHPPAVSFSGLDTLYCSFDNPVSLTGTPSGGTFSGPGINGNIFDPVAAGTGLHTIVYTYADSNGCAGSYSFDTRVEICPGINDIQFENHVRIYPNPSNKHINISVPEKIIQDITSVRVWDIQGRLIGDFKFDSSGMLILDVSRYSSGLYFISINFETLNPITKRLVVYD